MNFKEALIAHLQGEKVEVNYNGTGFDDFAKSFSAIPLDALKPFLDACGYEFRLAPRSIMVNGVEVPAPETVEPEIGTRYYLPHPSKGSRYTSEVWDAAEFDVGALEDGLVYLDKESAIARAKAMLITQEAV